MSWTVTRLAGIPNPISTQLLSRLSVDFGDVERRAQSIANNAVSTATWRAAYIPIGVAIITVLGTLLGAAFFSPLQSLRDDIVKLRSDLGFAATKVEEGNDIHKLGTDLTAMKVQIEQHDKYDERLRALENTLNALQNRKSR